MKAQRVDYITLTAVGKLDGKFILETDCSNFDEYKALPQVVEYQGVLCGKTGWSSDRHYACYHEGVSIAKVVR